MIEHSNGRRQHVAVVDAMAPPTEPTADDYEKALLGCLLRHPDAIDEAVSIVQATDFRTDAHRKVFAQIVALHNARKPADSVTVADALKAKGELDDVRYTYLHKLCEAAIVPAAAIPYAEAVREHSIARRLSEVGRRITHAADNCEPVGSAGSILEFAENEIYSISEVGRSGEAADLETVLNEAMDAIDLRAERNSEITGVPSGLIDLDMLTAGWQPSELIIFAARPSIGKTSFSTQFAYHAAMHGTPVFFASLEQRRTELGERILVMAARVNSHRTRTGRVDDDDVRRMVEVKLASVSAKLFIDDTPSQTMTRIASNARRMKRKHGIGLVVIDYLQLITVERQHKNETRQEQVSEVSRRLKILARELEVPVIALAQLNRAAENRDRPKLSDLRESGAIEQNADVVMLLHRPDENSNVLELLLAKQRNGPTGILNVVFDKEHMRAENYAPPMP